MQFIAPKNAGLVVPVRDPEKQYFPDGRERLIRAELVADFAEQAILETYVQFNTETGDPMGVGTDPDTGETIYGATFTAPRGGGWFDTEEAQRAHQWTDEEREFVEAKLLTLCPNNPNPGQWDATGDGYGRVEVFVPHRPEAPWPKFDDQKPPVVVRIAKETEQVEAALAYESSRGEQARDEVVAGLRALLDSAQAEEELTAA